MKSKLHELFGFPINIKQIEGNEHDRHIYTDHFDIFISKGLETFDQNNRVNIKEAKITIDRI